jgi:putative flippase GtrA
MFKIKLTDRATQVRFFRFVAVGGAVALVNFSALAAARRFWPPNYAFTAAFLLATSVHYCFNKFWALPSERRDTVRQFGEYLLAVALSYLINFLCFNAGRSILGLDVMWAAVCAVPPASLVVFLVLNYRVFRVRA